INQRERDFEISFEAAVDLALAQSPDAVIWLGDVFDHPRPTYRSFCVAQRAAQKIRDHGVPLVAITGNHDTPRLAGTGSPYSALSGAFPEMHWAHRMAYERFELGGLVIHAVPQMLTVEATLDALAEAARSRSGDHTNLLLTHPRLPQVEPRYADINEIQVDAAELQADLVLLGHYHVHTTVRPGVWYAGSTDSFSFADDPGEPKGIVLLDTATGECTHKALPGQRPLVTLETVAATGLSPAELQNLVLERVATVPQGAVARLYIEEVEPESYRLLDLDAVRSTGSAALHLKLEPRFTDTTVYVDLPDLDTMPARWDRYLDDQDLTGYDRPRISAMGEEYLSRAVEIGE
ncbi:MAG: metallophosphoesterase, partial [Acidimicrobiales bacterium]